MNIDEAYNTWSDFYDDDVNPTRDLDLKVTKQILGNDRYNSVLELGCGTGKNTSWLIDLADKITGLDFSFGMLQQAKKKFDQEPVEFIQADLTKNWPVDSDKFDLVTSCLILEHIEDLNHIFQEAERVMNSGGKFYISEYHPQKQYQGKAARFEKGEEEISIQAFVHHEADFEEAASKAGLRMTRKEDQYDDENKDIPRLITFEFVKP